MAEKIKKASKTILEEKKIGKYLKYAIGETAIVIVGILFVLTANFIREQIKENKSKMSALIALRNDVASDFKSLDTYWTPRLKRQEQARSRLGLFLENPTTIMDSVEFVNDVMLVSTYFTFNQNKASLEDLINGGQLNLIENDSLRRALLLYKYRIENVSESDLLHRAYFLEIQGRIGPKILEGLALPEILEAYHSGDSIKSKIVASRALNTSEIVASDDLRELLAATGSPFIVKKNGYDLVKTQSEVLLKLLDRAIDVE